MKLPHLSEPGSGQGAGPAARAHWSLQPQQAALPTPGRHSQGGRCEAAPEYSGPPPPHPNPGLAPSPTDATGLVCPQANSRRSQGCRFETLLLLLALRAISPRNTLGLSLRSLLRFSELSRPGPARAFASNRRRARSLPGGVRSPPGTDAPTVHVQSAPPDWGSGSRAKGRASSGGRHSSQLRSARPFLSGARGAA